MVSKYRVGNSRAAKLRPEQVLKMRELYEQGMTQRELGEIYDMSVNQVGRIVRNESWKAYKHTLTDQQLEHDAVVNALPIDQQAIAESAAKLAARLAEPPAPAEPQPALTPEQYAENMRRLAEIARRRKTEDDSQTEETRTDDSFSSSDDSNPSD